MDAREKWNETAKKIATEYAMRFGGYVKYPSGAGFDLCEEKLNELDAHLRTTPEGFALVPVEPTEAMKRALFVNLVHADDEAYVIKKVIEASKAPPPKSESL